jgi:transposase
MAFLKQGWNNITAFVGCTSFNKRDDVWWLSLTYDEEVAIEIAPTAPVVGIDVGITNFITTSTGKHYGTMHGKIRERHKRDRAKRRRKVKLRACLEKKGVKKLPSTSSCTGQRLIRHTKQQINRAVNECYNDKEHQGVQFAYSATRHQGGCFDRCSLRLR